VPDDPLGLTGPKPDTEKGLVQFTDFCRQLCERVRDLSKMEVLVEPLRPNGDNLINFVWQAKQVCEDVDSPRLKVIADLFHMMAGRETPRSLVESRALLRHCHIADWYTRNFVGEKPESLTASGVTDVSGDPTAFDREYAEASNMRRLMMINELVETDSELMNFLTV